MGRRSGVTLLEVLVAIFVMAIGLLALLTLFPLGALRMQQAIQQQKCIDAGYNAAGIGEMKSIAQDTSLLLVPSDGFLNPGLAGTPNAHPNYPSYPVLVDPIGVRATAGLAAQFNVAGLSYLARRSVSFVDVPPVAIQTPSQACYQWFTDLNDIDFENGAPGATPSPPGSPRLLVPANNTISRDTRYSWAYLVQRPRYGDYSVVDASIVVYYKRSVSPTGNTSLPEYSYPNSAVFDTNRNVISISYANNVPPPVRVGDWVMDNTAYTFKVPNDPNTYGSAHGYFYRAVGVNDIGGDVLEIEVETPLRGFPPNAQTAGTALVLDGVAEVYTKGVSR